MRSGLFICRADGWCGRSGRLRGFQLQSSDDGRPIPKFLNPTAGRGCCRSRTAGTNAFPADVLQDGRILFEAGFPLGEGSTPELFLVYADGSGVESCAAIMDARAGAERNWHRETWSLRTATSLARFTSALAHEVPVAAPRGEYAGAIAETASGAWLLSARTETDARFAIKIWNRRRGEDAHRSGKKRRGSG